ncbi:MAG: hypothetical protein WCE75_12995 [Terracidiphilus sp.]
MTTCTGMEERLADLLLAPETVPTGVREHLAGCAVCGRELEELRATLTLMDEWQAPEPSPYFLTRMEARSREQREAGPEGWLARLRDRFLFGPQMHTRPLAAMAMTVVLLLGGGTYLGITDWDQAPAPPEQTAVVHDLQNMDSNAQLLDQLETLSSSNDNGD